MDLKQIIDKIDILKKELDNLRPIMKEYDAKIWQKIRLDWNFHSNHIEGNSLTFGETKALLEKGTVVNTSGKPKKDYDEIEGHNKAIDLIVELSKNKAELTEAMIRELHKTILPTTYKLPAQTSEGKLTTRNVIIGEYKKQPNHVLTAKGETFYFAKPEETKPKMMDLMDSFRSKTMITTQDILISATEFHYRFVLIHPFDDGNGRLSRLLLNYYLLISGFPPVVIKTDDKKNYFGALEASDAGSFESLVTYIGTRLIESLELYIKGAKGEYIEEPDDLDKQITLLQKKVESLGLEEARIEKDRETVALVFENSIFPLLIKLFIKLEKVFDFFRETNINLNIDNSLSNFDKSMFIDKLKKTYKMNSANIQHITLLFSLVGFKGAGVNDFNEDFTIKFFFEKYKYIFNDLSRTRIEKLYHQFLSEEEIEIITNGIVKHCLNRIDKKIDSLKDI